MDALQLTDEVIATLNDEQLMILQELGELAAKKMKITRVVDQFNQQVSASQKTMGFQPKGSPGDLHEDPEVLSLVTIKERYKLSNIDRQIARTLRRAVVVGLGNLALIQRQCRIHGINCTPPNS